MSAMVFLCELYLCIDANAEFPPIFSVFRDDILLDIIFQFPYLAYCIQYTQII